MAGVREMLDRDAFPGGEGVRSWMLLVGCITGRAGPEHS